MDTAPDSEATAASIDLTSCDQEPIHKLGQIQPRGFLLAFDEEGIVCRVSANVSAYLGLEPEALLGRPLHTLLDSAALHDIRGRLQGLLGQHQTDRLFGVHLLAGAPGYDVAVHFVPGDVQMAVLEAEPSVADPGFDAVATVKGMMARLVRTEDMASLHDLAARQLRRVLGFDRVMVYRFEKDGSGEVVGESAAAGLESFRGLHYPASDIPVQARAMYCRNWLRLISDVGASTVPILPLPGRGEEPLDLSSSTLRSVSPIHIEYLGNMGVAASLSISIMRGGELWGLLACHHSQPLRPGFQRCSAAELFGQFYSLLVENRERAEAARYDIEAREMADRVLTSRASDGDLAVRLRRITEEMRGLVPCDGAAIQYNGRTELIGATPDEVAVRGIIAALDQTNTTRVIGTREIARIHPPAAAHGGIAAGMLVIPIARGAGDYLIFFRREILRTITWAGDPAKLLAGAARRLTPRLSFEAWKQTVRGQSAPWSEVELRIAESLRISLLEVVVGMLSAVAGVQQRVANERQELLIGELNHRVRNILALIRALVSRSEESAGTLENFVASLNGRIQSLARAHDQLTDDRWGPVALRGMIESEFHAYLGDDQQGRTRLSGPPIQVEPQALTVLALVVHELATNSVKYGALTGRNGIVDVRWRMAPDGALRLSWKETGGPPVKPPSRQGFGTTVIERTIPFELQGSAAVRYRPGGLQADFTVPARFVHVGVEAVAASPAPVRRLPAVRFSGTAMVVEDSTLLALDAEEILLALGFDTVEVVATAADALKAVERTKGKIAFALLDANLGDHTSLPVGEELLRRGIPFAFATGYGKRLELPPSLAGNVAVVAKPYRRQDIAELVGLQLAPG